MKKSRTTRKKKSRQQFALGESAQNPPNQNSFDLAASSGEYVSIQTMAWLVGLMTILSLVIFWPASDAPFVFDSVIHIQENEKIQELFSGSWFYSRRFLANLSLAIDHQIFGSTPSNILFTNILIHVAAGTFLFLLIQSTRQLIARKLPAEAKENNQDQLQPYFAAIVSLIWLVHPLQTQAVIYHVQRMESLMGLFMLLSLWLLSRHIANGKMGFLVASVLAAAASICSKEVGLVAPALMWMYYYVFQQHEVWQKKRAAMFTILLVMLAGGLWAGHRLWLGNQMGELGFPDRLTKSQFYLASQGWVLLLYLKLTFFPIGQNLDHGFPYVTSLLSGVLPLVLLAATLVFGLVRLVQRKTAGLLIVGTFLVLAPTSSILPISDLAVEHRMYVPLAALIVGMVALFYRLGIPPHVRLTIAAFVIVGLTTLSYGRCQIWRDPVLLWRDSVARAPHNYRSWFELGTWLVQQENFNEAIECFGNCLERIDSPPHRLDIQLNIDNEAAFRLARLYAATNQVDKIRPLLKRWFDGDEYFNQHLDIAIIFAEAGDWELSQQYFQSGLKLATRPQEKAFVLVEHGYALLNRGEFKTARRLLESAVELDARNWKAHNNLGIAIMSTDQDLIRAGNHFRSALEIAGPQTGAEAQKNLARVQSILRQQKRQ